MFRVACRLVSVARFPQVHNSVAKFSQPAATEELDVVRARLLYQSKKRGILENDILLGDFADENLHKMDASLLKKYHDLINGEHMEWDLFYYLSGKKIPPTELSSCQAFKMVKEFVDKRKNMK